MQALGAAVGRVLARDTTSPLAKACVASSSSSLLRTALRLRAHDGDERRGAAVRLSKEDETMLRSALRDVLAEPDAVVVRQVTASAPAQVLERLARVDAVLPLEPPSAAAMRARLAPESTRACFALTHRALPDVPLVAVQLARSHGDVFRSMDHLFDATETAARRPVDVASAKTFTFFAINAFHGAHGLGLGRTLLLNMLEMLPEDAHCETLSPVPSLLRRRSAAADDRDVNAFRQPPWDDADDGVRSCARHLLLHRRDPVAAFHLANGSYLNHINANASNADLVMRNSGGVLVNYRYDAALLEDNANVFATGGIVCSPEVAALLPDSDDDYLAETLPSGLVRVQPLDRAFMAKLG